MDGTCNTHGEGEKSQPKFYWENLKRRYRSGNLVVHWMILLKSILNKWFEGVYWIYLNVLDHDNETSDCMEDGNFLHQVSACKLPNDYAPLNKYLVATACECLIPSMAYSSNLKVNVILSSETSVGYYASHIHIKICQYSQDRYDIPKQKTVNSFLTYDITKVLAPCQ
jgi:hypothetical protein